MAEYNPIAAISIKIMVFLIEIPSKPHLQSVGGAPWSLQRGAGLSRRLATSASGNSPLVLHIVPRSAVYVPPFTLTKRSTDKSQFVVFVT